jgi:hypothetical protein
MPPSNENGDPKAAVVDWPSPIWSGLPRSDQA